MGTKIQSILMLEPDVAAKLKILSHIHNKSKGELVTKFIERAWELEPQAADPAIHNLVRKYVKANLKSFLKKALESSR
jgi:hypothetical protein